jgi:putative transposase
MDRPPQKRRSYNDPGHAHELTFSCYNGFPFLKAERTCLWLAESIHNARAKHDFDLWAYVFMPEHVHIVVHPRQREYDMGSILRAIKEPVGRRASSHLARHATEWLEKVIVTRGRRIERRFWQAGGGFDRNVTEAQTLLLMMDYIHLNPVRRGLVERPVQWKWSSAAWFEGHPSNDLSPDRLPPEWTST